MTLQHLLCIFASVLRCLIKLFATLRQRDISRIKASCPLEYLLQGANNLVLEGVFHSISRKGSFADKSELVWYGSDEVVDAWLHALV